jgi:prenyltransferase beta subunit
MDVQLTYKGGFYLACQLAGTAPTDLVRRTYEYLHSQPNDDGGFGPWRGHSVGSDPWSTGVCLAGLARFPTLADLNVVTRAVRWLVDTQLPSGYWPYHFIDEGTAYAYWGLSEAKKLLETS